MKKLVLIISVFTFIMIAGCSTKKAVISTSSNYFSNNDIYNAYKSYSNKIEHLWIKKIKGKFYYSGKREVFYAGIRAIKDSVIVVVLRNELGMEGYRLFIEKDSITFINRIEKSYSRVEKNKMREHFSYLADFKFLQTVFLIDNLKIEKIPKTVDIETKSVCFNILDLSTKDLKTKKTLCFNKFNAMPESLGFIDEELNNYVKLRYFDYNEIDGFLYPSGINIVTVLNNSEYKLELYYDRIEINQKVPVKIKIPDNYIRVKYFDGI